MQKAEKTVTIEETLYLVRTKNISRVRKKVAFFYRERSEQS